MGLAHLLLFELLASQCIAILGTEWKLGAKVLLSVHLLYYGQEGLLDKAKGVVLLGCRHVSGIVLGSSLGQSNTRVWIARVTGRLQIADCYLYFEEWVGAVMAILSISSTCNPLFLSLVFDRTTLH